MFRIIVVARREGIQPLGQTFYGLSCGIVFLGEDDVEVTVEFGGGEVPETFGNEGNADKVEL